jgi:hypothetical protein
MVYSIWISSSSAGSGPAVSSSVFSGVSTSEEVGGIGTRGQEIAQWLMYRHSWRRF